MYAYSTPKWDRWFYVAWNDDNKTLRSVLNQPVFEVWALHQSAFTAQSACDCSSYTTFASFSLLVTSMM